MSEHKETSTDSTADATAMVVLLVASVFTVIFWLSGQ